jgi:hypothetical protein
MADVAGQAGARVEVVDQHGGHVFSDPASQIGQQGPLARSVADSIAGSSEEVQFSASGALGQVEADTRATAAQPSLLSERITVGDAETRNEPSLLHERIHGEQP